MLSLPKISSYDPSTTSDGSLDPLGLYMISERLSSRLAPGVRERMSHPRYLTASALGAHICSPFYDAYASDGVSPAYQVYEWHIVEGFTSKYLRSDPDQIQGLPGIQKAEDAINSDLALRSSRYLKTASVFGFHGVYRTLATELRVVSDDYRLQELGNELLTALQEEKNLQGIYVGDGDWNKKVELFRAAIKDSLEKGEVARIWSWDIHREFAEILRPNQIGSKEANIILNALRSESEPFRKQMLDVMLSDSGKEVWKTTRSEKSFLSHLKRLASEDLKSLIDTIEHYEIFAKTFQDAFNACEYEMSRTGKSSLETLAALPAITRAAKEMPRVFSELEKGLSMFDVGHTFLKIFSTFENRYSPKDWVIAMWEHHKKIQRAKGKLGKRTWFDRTEDGVFRSYAVSNNKKEPQISDEFLHYYRVQPLWSFLVNMKLVEDGKS